jgi:hypothetical protein
MASFKTFTEFFSREQLDEAISVLDNEKIEHQEFQAEGIQRDFTFGAKFEFKYELQIQEKDFRKAKEILLAYYSNSITEVDEEHFLNSYTDFQLCDIVRRKDNWSLESIIHAKLILRKRGIILSEEEIKDGIKDLDDKKKEGQDLDSFTIGIIYFFCVTNLIFAWIVGSVLQKSWVELSDSTRVPKYNENVRRHGKNLIKYSLFFNLAMLLLTIIFFIAVFVRLKPSPS